MNIAENITPEDLEIIDAFLMGRQTPAQQNIFSEKMQTDSEWENKIYTVRLLKDGINEAALKEKLETFHKDFYNTKEKEAPVKKLYPAFKIWWAAASVAALLLISLFVFKNNKYEKAYASYYKPDPGLITVMGIANNYALEEGMVQYKNEKYAKAIALWEEPLITNPANDTLLYFTAAAYQALQKPDEAIKNYLKVLQQKNSVFYKDACWYLGLIYLENKDKVKAEPLLLQSGREETTTLLKKLN